MDRSCPDIPLGLGTMRKFKKVTSEIRKLFHNGQVIQGCFPKEMMKFAGLEKGGHVIMIQKRPGIDITLKDGDVITRAISVDVE